MMHGREKSGTAIVAVKPMNNAERSAAEPGAEANGKPLRRTPMSDSPARRETQTALNLSNRRIRTRMYGGVGGEESRDSPYYPDSQSVGV
jgi:hypothetical protein